jgi:hypothetical protein
MAQNTTIPTQVNLVQIGRDIQSIGGGLQESELLTSIKLSYLEFRFYKDANGGYHRRYLPFVCGDVQVTESRKANYINYTPISRNTQIPFYIGSESRVFKVTYEIVPEFLRNQLANNQRRQIMKDSLKYNQNSGVKDDEKSKFLLDTNKDSLKFERRGGAREIFNKFTLGETDSNGDFTRHTDEDSFHHEFINHQIDLIRSSVINNAEQPTYGPPIIRLNNGLLHQNIPCICLDYNLDQQYQDSNRKLYQPILKMSKYKIVLTFTLQEVRNGNFLQTPFNTDDSIAQDNIVGWEQIIKGKSLDPITPILK